jgi:hypothetical protein
VRSPPEHLREGFLLQQLAAVRRFLVAQMRLLAFGVQVFCLLGLAATRSTFLRMGGFGLPLSSLGLRLRLGLDMRPVVLPQEI